jgi:hypothetical protein
MMLWGYFSCAHIYSKTRAKLVTRSIEELWRSNPSHFLLDLMSPLMGVEILLPPIALRRSEVCVMKNFRRGHGISL